MSDPRTDTSAPIDPKHPWIEDPRDVPGELNGLAALFNPSGETSRVHFTRAWTLLFFMRTFAVLLPVLLSAILAASGGDADAVGGLYALVPVVFVATAIMSLILHVRRLSDARRSPLWAGLVLMPMIAAAAVFLVSVPGANAAFDKTHGDAQVESEDAPPGDEASRAEARRGDARSGGRGRRGPPPKRMEFVTREAGGSAGLAWALSVFGVTLWSLLLVGRYPTGGGRIDSRLDVDTSGRA